MIDASTTYRAACQPPWRRKALHPWQQRVQYRHRRTQAAEQPQWPAGAREQKGLFSDVDKLVLFNAAGAAAAGVAEPLMSLVDTAFVGRCGVLSLAALGPNAALFNVIFFISFMAMAVIAIDNMAAANVSGDKAKVGRAFVLACAASLAVGLAGAAAIIGFPEQILGCFQTNAEIMPKAKIYATIRAVSTPFALLNVVFQAAFRALLDVRTPLLVVAIIAVVDIATSPILIFSLDFGIRGAAWATSGSQILGSLVFMMKIWERRYEFGVPQALDAMAARTSESLSRAQLWLALLRDLPWLTFARQCQGLALRAVLILSTYTLAAMSAAAQGTVPIAAHQVIQQLQQLQLAVAWSFLSVGQSLVSNTYNAPDAGPAAARRVGSRVALWGVLASALMALATWTGRDVLPRIFVQGSATAVLDAIAPAMVPACVMLLFSCNNALEGVLLGASDMRYVVGIYPFSVLACVAFLAAAWVSGAGLTGVWWGLAAYYACLVSFFGLRLAAPLPWLRGPLHTMHA